MSFFQDLQKVLRQNVREYGMYIALFVIMAIFTVLTNGLFLSPRNISNLINQTGYVAVLAVGMTLVIVIRHIDLSVGFLAGFLGAIAAILMVQVGLPTIAVIPIVLVLGIFAGLITAFLIVYFGIPAFVATLAGWLIYRGLLLQATMATGTIIIPNASFNAIGNGFIPISRGLISFRDTP
jgi:putative multiple sugar transport system permease protein